MAKVTWKDEDYELSLSCALYKLQQSNVLCDVVIVTKSGTIPVHRLIFYAFHATVYSDSNSQSGVGSTADSLFSKFYEFDSGIVMTLIRYLYTGEVTLDHTDVQEFCRLCKAIGLKKVAIAVEKINEQGQRSRLSDKSQSHDNTNSVCDNGHEKSQQHVSSIMTKSLEETLMERNSTIMTEIKKEPADLDLSDTEMSNDFEPNHANNDHEHDEEDQDKTLDDSDSVGNHDKTGVIKLSMCGQCSQIFKDREEFVRHMEIKHQLFVCTQCDFQERQKEKLDKHFQDVHANNKTEATEERTMQKMDDPIATVNCMGEDVTLAPGKSHQCDVCGNRYATKGALVRHFAYHSTEKKVSCPECGKMFYHINDLWQHRKLHGTNDLIICDECGKEYKSKGALYNHKLKNHGGDKEHHYCHACNKSFIHKSLLQKHMRVHQYEKQVCNICGKLVKNLEDHIKLCQKPSRPRSHECDMCGKKFKEKRYLHEHKKYAHFNCDRYECSGCSGKFSHRRTIIDHKKHCAAYKSLTEQTEGSAETSDVFQQYLVPSMK